MANRAFANLNHSTEPTGSPTIFRAAILFLGIALLVSCQAQEPEVKPPMPEDVFIRLYVEAMAIRLYTTPIARADSALTQLFQAYGLTKDKFEKLVQYYQENPERWRRVVTEADRQVMQLMRQRRHEQAAGQDTTQSSK